MTRLSSLSQLLHLIPVVFIVLINSCLVESRRGRRGYGSRTQGNPQHTRGADPLPWWAITLVFVGGVMGMFLCVMGLRKIYEKKRQQKMRLMLARRSINIQRRVTQQQGNNGGPNCATEGRTHAHGVAVAPPQNLRADAPPTYDQSQHHDSLPPAYYKEVDTSDERGEPEATPSSQRNSACSASMPTDAHIAPPSYDVATNSASEVVEMGGASAVEMGAVELSSAQDSPAVLEV